MTILKKNILKIDIRFCDDRWNRGQLMPQPEEKSW